MQNDLEQRLSSIADREDIFDLVRRERFARDQRHFTVMRDCFHADAHVRTSWFEGNGADYVTTTAERAGRHGNSKHWVFPAFARIDGPRATVESPALIFNRVVLDGVEVDTQVFCRFFSRVLRREGTWRLMSFEVLFERDVMKAVDPRRTLPIDWDLLATYRPTYRILSYIQGTRGIVVNQELHGDDRRAQLDAFHAHEDLWLAGKA